MESLKISVAMGTYNGGKYILEQLESLARQTFLPHELVVTDDGSTDGTLEIVEEFGRKAPFSVHIVRNGKNLGFPDNFLKAASLCAGDLIAFSDQDDVWAERKLETCAAFFSDPDLLLAVHSATVWNGEDGAGHRFPNFPVTKIFDAGQLNPFTFVPGFAMVLRRCVLAFRDNANRPQRLLHHDEWVWMLATSAGRVATISQSLALYRQHSSNVVGAPADQGERTFFKKLKTAANPIAFGEVAQREEECAAMLVQMSEYEAVLPWAAEVRCTAAQLRSLAHFHTRRSQLYARDSALGERIATYLRIISRPGYNAKWFGIRPGVGAALKDLLIGVFRLFRNNVQAD